jgi:hypothetical protein
VKGFFDIFLLAAYSFVASVIAAKYIREVSVFFYIVFYYHMTGFVFYWYNFCQWKWPFYLMLVCLTASAVYLIVHKRAKNVRLKIVK